MYNGSLIISRRDITFFILTRGLFSYYPELRERRERVFNNEQSFLEYFFCTLKQVGAVSIVIVQSSLARKRRKRKRK